MQIKVTQTKKIAPELNWTELYWAELNGNANERALSWSMRNARFNEVINCTFMANEWCMLAKEMDDFSLPAFYSRIYSLAPLVKRTTMDIVCLFVRSFALLLLLQLFGHFGDKFIALIKYRKLLPISKKSQFSKQNGSTSGIVSLMFAKTILDASVAFEI